MIDLDELERLAKQLRQMGESIAPSQAHLAMRKAADAIERLQAENAELRRDALEEAAGICDAIAEKRRSQMGETSTSLWNDATLDSMADGADECATEIRDAARQQKG